MPHFEELPPILSRSPCHLSIMSGNFPWYFAINDRPVKVIATPDGGMDVLVLNLTTGALERDMAYLAQCFEPGQNVQRLSEEEFNTLVETICASLEQE